PVWGRFVLHKLSRLACPYGLLLVLASVAMAEGLGVGTALMTAVAAGLVGLTRWRGRSPRAVSLIRSFLTLNLAALWATPSYYLGRTSVTWRRVEVDRT
ncbi:MAG: glycosyltransferase family 2 protein, partial [Candidatus Rokuibacteriota bacterium]